MILSVQSFLTTVFSIVLMLLTLVIAPVSAQAQTGQQEECFTQLQSSVLEIPAFSRLLGGVVYVDYNSRVS
jgi:integral membrane sensor domain MASE1